MFLSQQIATMYYNKKIFSFSQHALITLASSLTTINTAGVIGQSMKTRRAMVHNLNISFYSSLVVTSFHPDA